MTSGRRRPGDASCARVLVYWTLLTLGPLAIGASLSATSYVLALSGTPLSKVSGLARVVLDWLPFVIGGAALAALYVLVPNRRVEWRDALIGGFVASALGELASWGFGLYIRTGTLASIYGAFSAVPLFLLWVYLSWYAVLFGAAIAATLPMMRSTRFADEHRAGNRFLTAAALLRTLLHSREQGLDGGRVALAALARACGSGGWRRAPAARDGEARLRVAARRRARGKWLLTCDAEAMTLLPLFARLAVDPANSLLASLPELGRWLDHGLGAGWLQQPLSAALGRGRSDRRKARVAAAGPSAA